MILKSFISDIRREWCLATSDAALFITVAITGILTLLAVVAGGIRVDQREENQKLREEEYASQRLYLESAFDESLLTDSASEADALSDRQFELQMSARSPDLMRHIEGIWCTNYPCSPLSSLSVGASGEWPDHYFHRGSSAVQTLTRTIRPNPLLSVVGAFDLTFVIGTILPLAVIVLTYNVVATDREQGRWPLVRLHAPSVPRLVFARCLVRVGILAVTVITLAAGCVVSVGTGNWDAASIFNLGVWSAWVLGYLAFWSFLAVLVNSLPFSSPGAGLILFLSWTVLVVVFPTAVADWANRKCPIPPQSEIIAMEKAIQNEVERDGEKIWPNFLLQHPEIEMDNENPQQEYLLRDLAIEKAKHSRVQARLDKYYEIFLDRESIVDRAQLLSPLLAWRTAAEQSAGTSLRHYIGFAQQTSKFHREYIEYFERFSLEGREMSQPDIQNIPRFDTHQLESQLYYEPLLKSACSLLVWIASVLIVIWWMFRCRLAN